MGTFHRRNGFILYKPHFLLPYTNITAKPTPYRKLCAFLLSQKNSFCMIYKPFENMGTWGNVLISHILLVIPAASYPCHYTNLCPHMSQKRTHIHTHTKYHLRQITFSVQIIHCIWLSLNCKSHSIETIYLLNLYLKMHQIIH